MILFEKSAIFFPMIRGIAKWHAFFSEWGFFSPFAKQSWFAATKDEISCTESTTALWTLNHSKTELQRTLDVPPIYKGLFKSLQIRPVVRQKCTTKASKNRRNFWRINPGLRCRVQKAMMTSPWLRGESQRPEAKRSQCPLWSIINIFLWFER